jgi:4-diphosphocytidyl-2-C-methyl-D-erythritol kinase
VTVRPLREIAPGKVNLCLYLGPARASDGRHELVTVFESVTFADELTLTVLGAGEPDRVRCPGVHGHNLVTDALASLRASGWDGPPVRIEIEKRIPVAAGMGGGSADAAAALRLADRLAPLPAGVAAAIAAQLGADVPSQLSPGLWLGTGAGEVIEPIEPTEHHALAIVPLPDERLSTPAVYREADRLGLGRPAGELAALATELRDTPPGARLPSVNDLEPASRSLCAAIAPALSAIGDQGADAAFVCGSGPTCAGIWWGIDAHDRAKTAATALLPRFPDTRAVVPVDRIGHNSGEDR